MAKTCFEEWLWELACAEIKHYSDNGVFTSDIFNDDCIAKHQSQSFSGIGAHHQNAHAEHAIQTICTWQELSCYMSHFIGLNILLMIWLYGHLLSSMLARYTMEYLVEQQDSLQLNCSLRLMLIIKIFSELMSEDVLLLFWTLIFKTVRKFQNGSNVLG